MPDVRIVSKNGLLNGEGNNREWSVPGTCNQVLLTSKIAGETFRAQDIPNAGNALLCELVVGDNNLIVQHITIRKADPIKAKG